MNPTRKIFLVDDDEDILDLLKYNLVREGYCVRVSSDGVGVVKHAAAFEPDLIVLDIMLPGQNGIEICRAIRQHEALADVYIFFLTATSDDTFRYTALNEGGDEYIEKIIGLQPLLSKITAVLKGNYVIHKRFHSVKEGSMEIIRNEGCVYMEGKKLTLTKAEFEILFFLAQNKGRKVRVGELISILWGSKTFMDEGSLRWSIGSLQEKVGSTLIRRIGVDSFQFMAHPDSE
jgi:two-component system, OmpR family, alkaline phosphatase synthesis response regulator PhoP